MPTNEMNEKLMSKEWRDEHIKPVAVKIEDCDQVHNDEGY
jgi:hypothetical protein